MKACKRFLRAMALWTMVCCLAGGSAWAQDTTVSVSPTSLSFGVPGTAKGVASAAQPVSVTVSGGGSATVSSITITPGTNAIAGDFTESDTCGIQPTGSTVIAAPGCTINVTFTPSENAGTLENATLNVTTVPGGSRTVPLTGALGAIPLFNNPVDVATSNGNASFSSLVTIGSQPLNLSCPANPGGTISSSPDGLGNVVVDNYITLAVGTTPTNQTPFGTGAPAGNVCTGGVSDQNGNTTQQDCFSGTYRQAAGGSLANGEDPDSSASTWGVPPIPVGAAFANGENLTATINVLDAGVVFTSTRLFLVTQCTVAGLVPGGTITGNPIDPAVPSTQIQTSTFDGVGGQSAALTTDVSNSPGSVPSGTTQVTTDIAIPQALFSQLVKGTSAAPAVCLRLTAEKDTFGQTMCKGFLIQCWDPTHTTLSGDNCIPTPSTARNLFDLTGFDSPDAPSGTNFLGSACTVALGGTGNCATTNTGGISPQLIGPGILLGSDGWLCTPGTPKGDLTTCTNQQLDTSITDPDSYDPANCVLTGTLTGDVCPLDTLTQFKGASDPSHGSTTNGKNSIFVPVVNMPLPFTQTTMAGLNANGWLNAANSSANVTFVSNEANYAPADGNPPANTFVPAPPYSVTYGVAAATSAIPDTTFPVPGDATLYNPTGTKANLVAPICTATPSTFTKSVALNPGPGIYNLHYFTTDCAFTEELLFNPTDSQLTDATANWASFRTLAFGVDTVNPTLTCATVPAAPNGTNNWFIGSNPTANCMAGDDMSGFAPATGSAPAVPNTNGTVLQGANSETYSVAASGGGIPIQQVSDLAGNQSNPQGPFSTPTDLVLPTISGAFTASGNNFTVGQPVSVKYTCMDGGSGLSTCNNQMPTTSCPTMGTAGFTGSFTTTALMIDTSAGAVGSRMATGTAVDCAGNRNTVSLPYTVSFGSADLFIATLPSPLANVKSGSNLTYRTFVLNLGPNTANNVVVTDTIPNGTTLVSAISGTVTCTLAGCSDVASGTPCGVSGNVVTCSTLTVKPITSITGFVVKMVVNVTGTVSPVKDTASVTGSNPDPHTGNNTVTVSTTVKH